MKHRILVTDGGERAALAIVRSLGRRGHEVFVATAGRTPSLAGSSRFCSSERAVADPLRDGTAFTRGIEEAIRRWDVDVVLPVSEAAIRAVLARRSDFEQVSVRIPIPCPAAFEQLSDRSILFEHARVLSIPVPGEVLLRQRSVPDAEFVEALGYPLVIKPGRSVAGGTKNVVQYAADYADLRRRLDALPPTAFPVMLQQRVVGPGIGVFLLRWEDRVRAVFAHRRLREKPPSGGVSVYRESISADPSLVEEATRLLDAFGWQGVAMVEFKQDSATGRHYLMEVNARFWGSLQLAIDAGVDFPALLVDCLDAALETSPPRYRVGVRSRWWWGDVDHLLVRLVRSARTLDLPPDSASRLATIGAFLRWRRGDREEVMRVDDPRPFLTETIEWFRAL